MGNFFKAMVTSAGYAAGEKLVNGGGSGAAAADVDRAQLEADEARAERDAKKSELDAIADINFGDSSGDIADTLNVLFSRTAQLPHGFAALGDTNAKAKRKAIIEKIEYGLFKLAKVDPATTAYFQKKFDALTGKGK